jgi:hypothetical protein
MIKKKLKNEHNLKGEDKRKRLTQRQQDTRMLKAWNKLNMRINRAETRCEMAKMKAYILYDKEK